MKYLFFVSWLRAKEKKIVNQIDIDRMTGNKNIEESFKVLNDTDYALFISNKNHHQIEEIIEEERKNLKKTLEKMGLDKKTLDFLFLKDELILLSGAIKEKMLTKTEEKETNEIIKKYPDIVKEIEKRKFKIPEEIDDFIIETYFNKAINLCRELKEKQAYDFLKNYWQGIKENKQDLKKRDSLLAEMENKIIEKSKESIDGLLPFIAFFIKKRRSEYFIRTVFAAKKIGLETSKIYNMINS